MNDVLKKHPETSHWRTYFSFRLLGHGLELGPLHRPLPQHPGMTAVDYIDRYPLEKLREHYPELSDRYFVEPNIIGDVETLANIKTNTYDFLVSAHVIEHMRDPLAALEAWHRVVAPGGKIYLIVPDKRMIFDKDRHRTSLDHMIWDYVSPSFHRDEEHYLDYAVNVNKKRGLEAIEEVRRLVRTDYSIHYHVFIPEDIVNLITWFDQHIKPLQILEGPVATEGDCEFHLLLEVGMT